MMRDIGMIDMEELHRCVQLASELEQRLEKVAYGNADHVDPQQSNIEHLQWENRIMFDALLNCLHEMMTSDDSGHNNQLLNIVHHTVLTITEKRKVKEYTL